MADEKAEETLPEEVSEAVEGEQDLTGDAEDGTEIPAEELSREQLEAALEEARDGAEAARDRALRAQAEAENVRRRAQRDVEHAHKFALEKFTGELLPVLDSLEKSVEAAADETDASAIVEGIELSLKLALSALEKAGIAQFDPVGEPFDPELHEAMSMLESADAEPGSVLNVLQKGYTLNGRLVRAAMVLVAKQPDAT